MIKPSMLFSSALVTLLSIAFAASAVAGPVKVISLQRTGHATITAAGETDQESFTGPPTGNFHGQASGERLLPVENVLFSFDAQADLFSQFNPGQFFTDSISANLGASIKLAFDEDTGTGDASATASGTALYQLIFQVDEPFDFTINRSGEFGETNGGVGSFEFSFSGPDGVIESADKTILAPGETDWDPQPLSGTLPAGQYELLISVASSGDDLQTSNAHASFDLQVAVPIPLPPALWGGLLALCCGSAGLQLRPGRARRATANRATARTASQARSSCFRSA